jgi:hypothetical protein
MFTRRDLFKRLSAAAALLTVTPAALPRTPSRLPDNLVISETLGDPGARCEFTTHTRPRLGSSISIDLGHGCRFEGIVTRTVEFADVEYRHGVRVTAESHAMLARRSQFQVYPQFPPSDSLLP